MSLPWVAGSVRGRLLLDHRLGRAGAERVAAAGSLEEALALLADSGYGEALAPRADLRSAQRSVAATTLWNMRVLAGWLPPRGADVVRVLAAWFELVNIEERLAEVAGVHMPPPFTMGALATARRIEQAGTRSAVRDGLARSAWGDPGTDAPAPMLLALRLSWAARLLDYAPEAATWVYGALALGAARWRFLAPHPGAVPPRLPGIPAGWEQATGVAGLARALPPRAAWALAGVREPQELWRAEEAWWARVEHEATALISARPGRKVVVGVVVLLGTDARRVSGALESAAAGGGPEQLDG
jgi:hypothetical protein